ncbi:hypothetical protein [Neobacillus vireti]|uniref:hypothetical protein n=1 Tax=Neobacillus vireti TaxID=220686 RepID=UPI0030004F3C
MKLRLKVFIGVSIISMFLFGGMVSAATDFTQFGFDRVVAEKHVKLGKSTKISHSGIKIEIPEGAFEHEVLFQVLEGNEGKFQANAPTGEKVIMNFAFRVIDLETNEILGAFKKPVMFSYKDKDVNKGSIYYNVKTDGSFVNNNAASIINGKTLSHPVGGAPVGWVITSPK